MPASLSRRHLLTSSAAIAAGAALLNEAVRALNAVETIRKNTQPIWELQTTNEVAERILKTVEAIETKGGALVRALDGQTAKRS